MRKSTVSWYLAIVLCIFNIFDTGNTAWAVCILLICVILYFESAVNELAKTVKGIINEAEKSRKEQIKPQNSYKNEEPFHPSNDK